MDTRPALVLYMVAVWTIGSCAESESPAHAWQSSPVGGEGAAESPRPRISWEMAWTCRLRAEGAEAVLMRTGLQFREGCMRPGVDAYERDIDAFKQAEDKRTRDLVDAVDREYRAYLESSSERDESLSPAVRDQVRRAKDRVARGEPAYDHFDEFCKARVTGRFTESARAILRFEVSARKALVTHLAECVTPALDPEIAARLDARVAIEASDRGIEHRKYYAGLDPGLLVSCDVYGEMERSMAEGGALKSLHPSVFALQDNAKGLEDAVNAAVRRAVLEFDADAARALEALIDSVAGRSVDRPLTTAVAEQNMRAADQIVGGLIRRRWAFVSELHAILANGGRGDAARAWEGESGVAMFPSVYATDASDSVMEKAKVSEGVAKRALESMEIRYSEYQELRGVLRRRQVGAIVAGAGMNGRTTEATAEAIKSIQAQRESADAACAQELSALLLSAK